jgi:hypothetical protein
MFFETFGLLHHGCFEVYVSFVLLLQKTLWIQEQILAAHSKRALRATEQTIHQLDATNNQSIEIKSKKREFASPQEV